MEFYRWAAVGAGSLDDNRGMFARLSAFVIWSFVAATAVFWGLRFVVHAPQVPAHAVAVDRSAPVRGDLSRLFGAQVARAEEKSAAPARFKLIGVMAPKSRLPEGSGDYGLALIAVDGKPARAYAVGARLDNDLVLQSVGLRTASLRSDKDARRMLLELPPPTAAATGVLPVPGTGMRPLAQPTSVQAVPPPMSATTAAPMNPAPIYSATTASPAMPPPGAQLPGTLPGAPPVNSPQPDNSRIQ